MKRLFRQDDAALDGAVEAQLRASRARFDALVEESRELLVVLDADRRILAASRRARGSLEGVAVGLPFPEHLLEPGGDNDPAEIPYETGSGRETLVLLGPPASLAAYQELRAGFTAAVSHELRTPLARLMVLLEGLGLPGADASSIARQAKGEVRLIGELIDDVLFLSELESGRAVVSLGSTEALPVLTEVIEERRERAEMAGVELLLDCPAGLELPLRPRMLETIAGNLVDNAIRHAGAGSSLAVSVRESGRETVLTAADTGVGVSDEDLPRVFERFFRSDRARSSHGSGLGLAIVKHIVTTAGGTVEAARAAGGGLEVRCTFPRTPGD